MNNTYCQAVNLEACLPMVRRLAWSVARRCPGLIPVDDLYGEGLLGLVEARRRYDPTRGAAFTTYAWSRIRGRMLDFLRKETAHSHRVVFANFEGEGTDTPEDEVCRAETARSLQGLVEELPARRRLFMEAFLCHGDMQKATVQAAYNCTSARKSWNAFLLLASPILHAAEIM